MLFSTVIDVNENLPCVSIYRDKVWDKEMNRWKLPRPVNFFRPFCVAVK